ncbi:dienelactone hydrolase family protein [Undibacterium oligocarboniphilum]|uniref:Hydrolase n=1 Tax=Undibacterium oligocarboniphilum TaxID=666702 RepID=A0A850QJ51_9BURK|nr:hydrolase [Undibacterium oligocarboniphilum]MBC3869800.1 hydrolase [Undibacterium oligocarboniphilum]NVO77403.1 hydrolase [Undibacterium oligocarboniphilum]
MSASIQVSSRASEHSPSRPTALIATDVFGHTPAIDSLARQLAVDATIISPFADPARPFRSEQEAYEAFIAGGGIARYTEKIAHVLEQAAIPFQLALGFSAGASALWLSVAESPENNVNPNISCIRNAVLFYGSRIREYRMLRPTCPVRLIFAEQEAAFEPAGLVQDLRQRGHAAEIHSDSKHGFMNAYSRGYCVQSYTRYLGELSAMLHPSMYHTA